MVPLRIRCVGNLTVATTRLPHHGRCHRAWPSTRARAEATTVHEAASGVTVVTSGLSTLAILELVGVLAVCASFVVAAIAGVVFLFRSLGGSSEGGSASSNTLVPPQDLGRKCMTCGGTGRVFCDACSSCGGSGRRG